MSFVLNAFFLINNSRQKNYFGNKWSYSISTDAGAQSISFFGNGKFNILVGPFVPSSCFIIIVIIPCENWIVWKEKYNCIFIALVAYFLCICRWLHVVLYFNCFSILPLFRESLLSILYCLKHFIHVRVAWETTILILDSPNKRYLTFA